MFPTHPRRARRLVALAALTLALGAPATALATDDGVVTTYRTAPSGTDVQLEDIAADDGWTYAGWVEDSGGSSETRFLAADWTHTNMVDWVDLSDHADPRVDRCGQPVGYVGVTTYAGPGGRALALRSSGTPSLRPIEENGTDYRRADVACDGDRIAMAVNRVHGGKARLILWVFKPDLTDGATTGWDLGPVSGGVSPAIDAGGGAFHVAWRTGTSIKVKRFLVGPAPAYALTPKPTITLDTSSTNQPPRIAADGKRVIVAWQRGRDVVARVSTDKGASFGTRRTILAGGSASSGKVAWLDSLDVDGSIIVAGTATTQGITGSGRVRISTNNGAAWSTVPGLTFDNAFVFAALDRSPGNLVLQVAYDERISSPDPATLKLLWAYLN